MFECLTYIMNNSSNVNFVIKVDKIWGTSGLLKFDIENAKFGDPVEDIFEFKADNIYDALCEAEEYLGGYANYDILRKNVYGLNAVSEMSISNDDCLTLSKSKGLLYREKYCYHDNFDSFLMTLHRQISSVPDYSELIEPFNSAELSK